MPVKRVIPREQLPPELLALLPEAETSLAMLGSEIYEIVPLAAGEVEKLAVELVDLAREIFSEVSNQAASDIKTLTYATMADAFQRGIKKTLEDGTFLKIATIVTDVPIEELRKCATVKQLYHLAGIIWKQNFDMSSLSEGSRKNFESLLGTLGLRSNAPDPVYQWADYALRVLSSPKAGSPSERIAEVLKVARANKLTVDTTTAPEDMPDSPPSTDSAGNTSSEPAK